MPKRPLFYAVVGYFFCLISFASPYDLCKDILRNGVRDTISTHDTVDKKLASHNQFCSISKENNLNENNFHKFAKDYAKAVQTSDNSYGGGGGASFGPFSFNANYRQTNNKQELSLQEKEDFLNKNSKQIIEYYNENCGQSSSEDLLKTEATLLSKIANINIVNAWRECMLNNAGFFAELMSSPIVGNETEIQYSINVLWKSNEGTRITSITLQYLEDKIIGAYELGSRQSGFVYTKNLCDTLGCLISGSSFPISIIHKNPQTTTTINVIAKTSTGMLKSHVLILPKIVPPEVIKLDSVTPNSSDELRLVCKNCHKERELKTSSDGRYWLIKDGNDLRCDRCNMPDNVTFKCIGRDSVCHIKVRTDKGLIQSLENPIHVRGEETFDLKAIFSDKWPLKDAIIKIDN